MNAAAVAAYHRHPQLYNKLVQESVTASQRIEGSYVSRFQEGLQNLPLPEEEVDRSSSAPDLDESAPVKRVSFEEYYRSWAAIATSVPLVEMEKGGVVIRAIDCKKASSSETTPIG